MSTIGLKSAFYAAIVFLGVGMQSSANAGVLIYTMNKCKGCQTIEDFLHKNNVTFRECNIDEDQSCLKEFNAQNMQWTPAIFIDGTKYDTLDLKVLENILKSKGYIK